MRKKMLLTTLVSAFFLTACTAGTDDWHQMQSALETVPPDGGMPTPDGSGGVDPPPGPDSDPDPGSPCGQLVLTSDPFGLGTYDSYQVDTVDSYDSVYVHFEGRTVTSDTVEFNYGGPVGPPGGHDVDEEVAITRTESAFADGEYTCDYETNGWVMSGFTGYTSVLEETGPSPEESCPDSPYHYSMEATMVSNTVSGPTFIDLRRLAGFSSQQSDPTTGDQSESLICINEDKYIFDGLVTGHLDVGQVVITTLADGSEHRNLASSHEDVVDSKLTYRELLASSSSPTMQSSLTLIENYDNDGNLAHAMEATTLSTKCELIGNPGNWFEDYYSWSQAQRTYQNGTLTNTVQRMRIVENEEVHDIMTNQYGGYAIRKSSEVAYLDDETLDDYRRVTEYDTGNHFGLEPWRYRPGRPLSLLVSYTSGMIVIGPRPSEIVSWVPSGIWDWVPFGGCDTLRRILQTYPQKEEEFFGFSEDFPSDGCFIQV